MGRLRFGLMTILLMLAIFTAPAYAQHIRMALVPETATPAPEGEVMLALVATPEPGWHGYWKNPGDAGVETRAEWRLPYGITAGPLQYPVPQPLLVSGLMNHVYEGPFVLFATLRLHGEREAGAKLPVAVKLDYLVCTDRICVPETQTLTTDLAIGDGTIPADRGAQFARWRAKLPQPLPDAAHFAVADGRLRLAVPVPAGVAVRDAHFFPLAAGPIAFSAPQTVTRMGDQLVVGVAATGAPGVIEGVLAIGDSTGFAVRATPGPVPPADAAGQGAAGTALIAFAGAVLGGLLLNIMPCVFPILSLKALKLAKANAEGSTPRREAIAYTAGVVLVCLALGGTLLVLRAAGASVGWAFQLQDPRVILLLLLLVTGIALNLAGLFEIGMPRFVGRIAAQGTSGAFATGALAAFVATPCTGPFMSAALGAALVLPWPAALAVFAGLGFGLALPFLLLGFVPPLRRLLPRPGGWMETFRHILVVPMLATALALAWVLGRQAGVDGMGIGLGLALLLGLSLWWTGARQAHGRRRAWAPAVLALVVAGVALPSIHTAPSAPRHTAGAEPFSEARLAALRREQRPVFAYFTADWCVTCKVNEKAVIETDAVQSALARGRVAVLVGDWTDGDPALGAFIARHNRAGVPLYLWYMPGDRQPRVLPQLLTRRLLIDMAGEGGPG